jgi:hypothetical protein
MLIFILFLELVSGIALPHVPRTASPSTESAVASTSTAVPASITAPPTIPTQWVLMPSSVEWPCYLINSCFEEDLPIGQLPPATANLVGDFHTEQPAWLVDPYQHLGGGYQSDYTYDSTCGMIWMKSLKDWMATASTTLGPVISASDVYYTVTGTTSRGIARNQSLSDSEGPISTSYSTWTNSKGILTTERIIVQSGEEEVVWQSTTRWTTTITGYTSLLSTRSEHRDTYFVSPFSFVPSSPCCSSCTLYGGTVQVYAWPTPAPQPPTSILVDTINNFTL